MQTTHPPRVVIAHEDHALAVAHDVERDVRARAAGVGRAAVDEQLVGRLGGVEDDELRRAHAHAEDGAVLACPFEELRCGMLGLGWRRAVSGVKAYLHVWTEDVHLEEIAEHWEAGRARRVRYAPESCIPTLDKAIDKDGEDESAQDGSIV